jgi:uncharacterized protein with PIN domain
MPMWCPLMKIWPGRACQIFQRFGKGQGHGAQLNFGDCFAAALAEREQCPLACVGDDFRAAGF